MKPFVIGFVLLLVGVGGFLIADGLDGPVDPSSRDPLPGMRSPNSATPTSSAVRSPSTTNTPASGSKIELKNVPFVVQAPFGDWSDPRQQNGCEEASLLMAYGWLTGKSYTSAQALDEILAISRFEEGRFGFFTDTSAQDTAQVMKEYFKHDGIRVQRSITAEDIIHELKAGNLVVTPANGQRIGNVYFTQPGPLTHMLVIYGYDEQADEFITNDPGTRRGQGYRYKTWQLLGALQDYPSGPEHGPQIPGNNAMIIVSPR